MSKVVPFRGRSVSPKMKVKKGGFLEELRALLAPVGVNPTVTALGLTAASRGLSKPKRRSAKKARKSPAKKAARKGRKQKGGDLLSELIAPQGLSATGTAALLLGANALARKSPAKKRRSPAKKASKPKRKSPAKKASKPKRKSPAKKAARKPAKKAARKSPAKKAGKRKPRR